GHETVRRKLGDDSEPARCNLLSLRLRGRPRVQRQKRQRRQTVKSVIMPEAVVSLRHAIHTYHHLEHAMHRRGIVVKRVAGEPLTITIYATVNLEDMEEVPPEQLEALEAEIHEILEKTAISIIGSAKTNVPVRTGRLRDSIAYM